MEKRKGFTLIELLVVISIIALLMAILIPALAAAKKMAAGSACLTNQKSLTTAWFTYTIENDGKLVVGNTYRIGPGVGESWVFYPINMSGSNVTGTATLEDEKRGIERGTLFPYMKDLDAYHCPADKRYKKPPTTLTGNDTPIMQNGGFRSYSIASCMNGEDSTGNTAQYNITIHAQIKNPANKYVFIEEDDPRGLNRGGWVLDKPDNITTGAMNWTDRMAVLHNEKSTLGWADCHATMQRWSDRRTMLGAKLLNWNDWQKFAPKDGGRDGQNGNQDLVFMKQHFPHLGRWK